MSNTTQKSPPSMVRSFVCGLLCVSGSVWLHAKGKQGWEAAPLGSMLLGVAFVSHVVGFFNAWDIYTDKARLKEQLADMSDQQGTSKLGDLPDAKEFELRTGYGPRIGRLKGQLLTNPSPNGTFTIGPPNSKKSLQFMEVLMTLEIGEGDGNPFSVVAFDPGAEMYCVTAQRQRELGREVVVHCPEWQELSRALGVSIPHQNVNPCEMLSSSTDSIVDDAKLLASLLYPGTSPERANGSTVHFDRWSRKLIAGRLLHGVDRESEMVLPLLQSYMASTSTEHIAAIAEMQISDAFDGALGRMGNSLETPLTMSPGEWSGILDTASEALEVFESSSPFGKAVSSGAFKISTLNEVPTCFYIIVSPQRATTHAAYNNLLISQTVEMLARRHSSVRRTLYLIDEAPGLGYMPYLVRAMEQYRKFGQVIWWGIQQISQLQRLYGRETTRLMLGMADLIQAYSIRDIEDCRILSELVGNETARDGSHSVDIAPDGTPHVRYSGHYRSRPLLRPEDIRMLPADKQLFIYRNAPAFVADKLNYLNDRALLKMAGENPYYRKS